MSDFNEIINSDKPTLVDFYADWCGPCKMLAPIVEEVAKEFDGKWKVGKCDIDSSPGLVQEYGIQSVPTLMFVKDGKVVEKLIGFRSKEDIVAKMS